MVNGFSCLGKQTVNGLVKREIDINNVKQTIGGRIYVGIILYLVIGNGYIVYKVIMWR